MGCVCGTGGAKPLHVIFDEYASLLGSIFEEYALALANLIMPFESFANAMTDLNVLDNIPLLSTKKKLKHTQPAYRMNYIQPQIKKSKHLPYQRRIY